MMQGIPWHDMQYIIELGPGTGVFTDHIIKRANPSAEILVIELEDSYLPNLRAAFGHRIDLVHSSAHRMEHLVAERGWPRIDLIVSGLPYNLPSPFRTPLLDAFRTRSRAGTIIRCFTYFPPGMRRAYAGFHCKTHRMILLNFPPMWIYEPKG